ncbi:MAG TPA: nuclear transport factor 2 family protein [Acidimicrobiia bacterium]|nr:nuclear transport factor 2 family protein [Acidimicrobiia bacterium]
MTAPGVVERYLDAIIGHDWSALAACLSDDGFARVGPWGDEYDDKAEYVDFIADLMPKLPGYEMRVDRVTYSADGRVAVVELTETVEIEGLPHPTPEALVFDLDGDPEHGRIRRIQVFIQTLDGEPRNLP